MKKILLLLFFIATSTGITRLSAYCFYNYSKDKTITIYVFKTKTDKTLSIVGHASLIALNPMTALIPGYFGSKAKYVLKPGSKRCRNWKNIDKKNQKRQWYWVAFKGTGRKHIGASSMAQGLFPIGGAVYYSGWYKDEFSISYGGKEWEYWKSPWNHKVQPWLTGSK